MEQWTRDHRVRWTLINYICVSRVHLADDVSQAAAAAAAAAAAGETNRLAFCRPRQSHQELFLGMVDLVWRKEGRKEGR